MSKIEKIGRAIAQTSMTYSPLMRRTANMAGILEKTEDNSRLGNAVNSLKEYAIGQTRLFLTLSSIKNFIEDLFEKETDSEKESENISNTTSTKQSFSETLNEKDNPLLIAIDKQHIILEKVLDVLTQQLSYMKEMINNNKENTELNKMNADLNKVSRNSFVSPNNLTPSSAANINEQINTSPLEELLSDQNNDQGLNLTDIAVGGAAGVGALGIIRGGISRLKNGAKSVGSKITSVGSTLAGKVSSVTGSMLKNPSIPKFINAAKDGTRNGIRNIFTQAPNLLSKMPNIAAVTSKFALGTMLGPVASIMTPSELGTDDHILFRTSIYDELEKNGVAAIPKVAEMLNSDKGQFFRKNFPEKEFEILANPEKYKAEVLEIAKSYYKPISNNMKNVTDIFYGDSNQRFNKAIQNFTKGNDGSLLTPDMLRNKMEPNIKRMQTHLEILNRSTENLQEKITKSSSDPAVVIGKQGGVTNIHNGGNVTNIVTANDSLSLPQIAFNLPSGIH